MRISAMLLTVSPAAAFTWAAIDLTISVCSSNMYIALEMIIIMVEVVGGSKNKPANINVEELEWEETVAESGSPIITY